MIKPTIATALLGLIGFLALALIAAPIIPSYGNFPNSA
jgi:hypothetical protein